MRSSTRRGLTLLLTIGLTGTWTSADGQDPTPATKAGPRGSLVEDRAARKLIEAGQARFDADEVKKAVEVWESVLERYPRSSLRYTAHMKLGDFFLNHDRSFDRARVHYEAVTAETNRDDDQRAVATLRMGVCFYEARNYGKTFNVMRALIQKFPVSSQVNQAYYYIGLAHFQQGHYSRAIAALEKVGTSLTGEDDQVERIRAGKRLFVKIEDADLAAMESGEAVTVFAESTGGDREAIKCYPLGRNVRIVLGSLPTRLGRPHPNNGILEVKGDDKVQVVYRDQHTADKQFDRKVLQEVTVVGDGHVQITDGAFQESLRGVVLGKSVNAQVADADRDVSDKAETLEAQLVVYRLKTDEEVEAETVKILGQQETSTKPETPDEPLEENEPKVDPYKQIDTVTARFTESRVARNVLQIIPSAKPKSLPEQATKGDPKQPQPNTGATQPLAPPDNSIHSGVFRATIPLVKAEKPIPNDDILQALPGDMVHVIYLDERHTGEGIKQVQVAARCIEGNLGGVRVTRAQISDQELRVRTRLKTAHALTNIGNRYKEFGLKSNASGKYKQALALCEDIMTEANRLGGRLLEETYVQLWHIYFQMDKLELAAAMAQRLQQKFPNSGFVDDALLQLADVARKQGNLNRAIGVYNRLVNMQTSQLRGEAQFGVAECYTAMADAAEGVAASQLHDRAFQEYKRVFDQFPDSGRVGEAVARMANYYYRQKDYARAIDTFETVLASHPDAKFLDVILFNYGRCLYRMDRRREARVRFDQLIADYPESKLASDAKKISEALSQAGL
ncbi:MAG: tetratricopeptide repeat protein [Planctomycetaceae bacterium]